MGTKISQSQREEHFGTVEDLAERLRQASVPDQTGENDFAIGLEMELYAVNDQNFNSGRKVPANKEDIVSLLKNVEDIESENLPTDLNEKAAKLKENQHPIDENPEFSPEFNTDFGLHQFESAGLAVDNPADLLYEARRQVRNSVMAARNTDNIDIVDASLVGGFMFPDYSSALEIEKFFEEVVEADHIRELEDISMDHPRYETFLDVDGDHFNAIAAPLALHVNMDIGNHEPDEFVSNAYNHHYVQQLLGSIFSNGPIIQEESSGVHEGRIPTYDQLLKSGRAVREFDESGEMVTDFLDDLDLKQPVPTNLNYMDMLNHHFGETVENLEDVVHLKMRGPLKQITDIDPAYIELEEGDADDLDEEVWLKVKGEPGDAPNMYDLLEEGRVAIEVENEFTGELVLPEDPRERAEVIENVYEDAETYARGSLDIKSQGLVEARQFSTNIERPYSEALTATGMIRNLDNVVKGLQESVDLEEDEYREWGDVIDRRGPDPDYEGFVDEEDGKAIFEDERGIEAPRTVYRELLPVLAEGVRDSFRSDSLPHTMKTVLANRELLEQENETNYDSFRELLEDNFDSIDEFLVFNESVIEPHKTMMMDAEEHYCESEESYSVVEHQEEYGQFKDWFIEKAYLEPMDYYLDPAVPTGSQEIRDEYNEENKKPEQIMQERKAKVV